jgi:hypothetical protein
MLATGVPVGAGTDATRVASYNPWTALYWLVTGRTVGGLPLYGDNGLLERSTALELWTAGSAWFSNEQGRKGRIQAGMLADLAVLSDDFFSVPEEEIKAIESVLTVVGGDIVYGAAEFTSLGPPPIPVLPEWSPVQKVPGHWRKAGLQKAAQPQSRMAMPHQCSGPCGVHAHAHDKARKSNVPVSDFGGFWGAFGCSCFAF